MSESSSRAVRTALPSRTSIRYVLAGEMIKGRFRIWEHKIDRLNLFVLHFKSTYLCDCGNCTGNIKFFETTCLLHFINYLKFCI